MRPNLAQRIARWLASPDSASARFQFLLRLGLWLLGYGCVMVAWGAHNSWPVDVWLSVWFLPLAFVVSLWLYRRNQFGWEINPHPSEWGVLITYLLFAVGIASGLMLLIAIGWVAIGVAYLRPARPTIAWSEWLKVPLLFLLNLPVLTDLAGSRQEWLPYFAISDDLGLVQGDWRWTVTRLQILGRAGLILFAWALPGTAFWWLLPVLPLALAFNSSLLPGPETVPGTAPLSRPILVWLFTPAAALLAAALVRPWFNPRQWSPGLARQVAHWVRTRSYAPSLASIIIILQQSSLVEGWLAGSQPPFDLPGAMLLAGTLAWFRMRTPGDRIHLNSRLLLAGALFVLLAAEWTDLNPLRHFSLGMLIISLFSWRRSWSAWVILGALVAFVGTLPGTAVLAVRQGMEGPAALAARSGLFLAAFVVLLACAARRLTVPHPAIDENYLWQPVKRFAFILVALLLVFQTVSAFWPERESQRRAGYRLGPASPFQRLTSPVTLPGMAEVEQWQTRRPGKRVELIIGRPKSAAVELNAPDLTVRSWGWRIVERRLLPHPRGEAVGLVLRRDGQKGAVLFWFEHDRRAFTNYLRARRVLWSGWNLDHRDLRLVLIYSAETNDLEHLLKVAAGEQWLSPTTNGLMD